MTGKERILTSMSIKEPDRVPLYIHGINEAPIIGIGRHLRDGLPEVKSIYDMDGNETMILMDTLFLIHEAFEIDGFTAFEAGSEKILDAQHVRDDWGVVYERSPYGLPVASVHPIKTADDLRHFKRPEPRREHLVMLDLARDRFKGEKAIFWMMRGAFVKSWRLTGMENMMIQMFDDPDFVHAVARMVTDYNLDMMDMLIDAGMDVLIVEDDIADKNFPLVSLEQFRTFIESYNRELVDKAHAAGLKVMRHSDGNLWPLLDTMLESGYDGLNPLEPQAGMEMKRVKAYCGDKICLIGNIDCIDLLPNGTPVEVEAAVKQVIEDAAAGGGLIITDSNSLHPGVNPENCIAMFEATRKHGRYTAAKT